MSSLFGADVSHSQTATSTKGLARHKADATSSRAGLVCAVSGCGRRVTQVHHRDGTISFRHDPGTLTECSLEGVHEHAFRGPHRFREWDLGT